MENNHYGTRRVAEVNQAPYQVVQWDGAFAVADMDEYMNDNKESSVIVIDKDFNKLREIVDRLNKKYGEAFATVVHKPHTVELTPEADTILDAVIEDRKATAIQELEKHPVYSLMRDIVAVSGSEKVSKAFDDMMVDARKTPVDKGALLSEIIEKGIGGILHKNTGGLN